MAVKRWRNLYLQFLVGFSNIANENRKVAFEMQPQGQEVRNDDDAPDSVTGQAGHSPRQVRLPELQESRLDMAEATRTSQFCSHRPHRFIRRLDPGTVRENHDPGGQALPWI